MPDIATPAPCPHGQALRAGRASAPEPCAYAGGRPQRLHRCRHPAPLAQCGGHPRPPDPRPPTATLRCRTPTRASASSTGETASLVCPDLGPARALGSLTYGTYGPASSLHYVRRRYVAAYGRRPARTDRTRLSAASERFRAIEPAPAAEAAGPVVRASHGEPLALVYRTLIFGPRERRVNPPFRTNFRTDPDTPRTSPELPDRGGRGLPVPGSVNETHTYMVEASTSPLSTS